MPSEDRVCIDPLCNPIYQYFVDPRNRLSLLLPEPGYGLIQSGLVVAEAELAWPRKRAAIVLAEDDYKQYTVNNWRVWVATSESDDQSDYMELIDLSALLAFLRSDA